jgi:hypothetical protein
MDDEKREAMAKYERDVVAKHKAETGGKPYGFSCFNLVLSTDV